MATMQEESGPSRAAGPRAADAAPPVLPRPDRRTLLRAAIAIALTIVVLGAGFAVLRAWLDGRWYVGAANGNVAIYQGIPAELLGFDLSHVELETEIPAADAEALPLYAGLEEGLNQNSREEAEALIEQIREDLRRQARADRPGAG